MTNPFAAFDPPVRPPSLSPTDISYAVEDTPVGRLLLAVRDSGELVTCAYAADVTAEDHALQRLADHLSPRILRHPAATDDARRELAAYLDGTSHTLAHPVDLSLASAFQRSVLGALTQIGYGATTTYGELAAAIDRPGAARAVGTALGGNPLCIVVPCHRVLPASGGIGGYAGGPAAKAHLLALESGRGSAAASVQGGSLVP